MYFAGHFPLMASLLFQGSKKHKENKTEQNITRLKRESLLKFDSSWSVEEKVPYLLHTVPLLTSQTSVDLISVL